jgi:hypothetical protein
VVLLLVRVVWQWIWVVLLRVRIVLLWWWLLLVVLLGLLVLVGAKA